MYICYNGHEEICYEYNCPACELLEKMQSCPRCKTKKDVEKTDTDKEIELLNIKVYNLETEIMSLKNENEELKKGKGVTIET